jgi:hypothetical protein
LHNTINNFFGNFNLLQPNLITGVDNVPNADGGNGITKKITFQKQGFTAYATLKFNRHARSDNLVYEYRAGQYINSVMHLFPCFVQTYHVYRVTAHGYDSIRNPANPNPSPVQLQAMLSEFDTPAAPNAHRRYYASRGCQEPARIALLTQFFNNCLTLDRLLRTQAQSHMIHKNFIQIFYQIYFALSKLNDTFTHYDLHAKNILLFPVPNVGGNPGHIHFNYGTGDNQIEFDCSFIVKIIDYGRSHYYINAANNSERDFNDIMGNNAVCNSAVDCGTSRGFGWMQPGCPGPDTYKHGIASRRPNRTHDLRVLDNVLWNIFVPPASEAKYRWLNVAGGPDNFPDSMRQILWDMTRDIHYFNNETGSRRADADLRRNDLVLYNTSIKELGAPQRMICGPRSDTTNGICNVMAAEVQLRTAYERIRTNYAAAVAANPATPNPFPFDPAHQYATIRCYGDPSLHPPHVQRPVEFVRT